MSKLSVITKVGNKLLGRPILFAQKYAPEILTGVGVVGVVASAVLASKATLKLEATIDVFHNEMELVKGHGEEGREIRNQTIVLAKGTMSIVKLYGPSVTLGLASLGCILGAHGIMKRRNVALVAAYKTLESSFNNYRKRVIEEFGEDKDLEFRTNTRTKMVKNPETGQKEPQRVSLGFGHSDYARIFDEDNVYWSETPEYNDQTLRTKQNWFNDLLNSRGHLFLNEVYDQLGFEHTQAGSVVGWVRGKNEGDGYVDLGRFKASKADSDNPNAIILDFNVDGVIYDLI